MSLGEAGLFFEVANGLHDLRIAVASEPANDLAHGPGLSAVVPDGLGEGVVGVGEVFQGGDVGAASVTIDVLTWCELQTVPVPGEKTPQPTTQCASSSGCSPAMNYR